MLERITLTGAYTIEQLMLWRDLLVYHRKRCRRWQNESAALRKLLDTRNVDAGQRSAIEQRLEEVRQMMRAISKDIEGLSEVERADLLNQFFHIVPEDEYDAAVENLKRTVKPDNMREILEIMERDKKAGVKTDFPFTAKMSIRSMLRHGGFAWKGNYLDDHCQQLLLDAAERFASEHPELEFDL